MKRLLASAIMLLSMNTHAFETDAACKKILFEGMTVKGTKVSLCILKDDNYHYYQQAPNEETPSVHFDIDRKDISFTSLGGKYNYRETFIFSENDLDYMMYYHINDDDEVYAVASISDPNGEMLLYEDIDPRTLTYQVTLDDVRGIVK